MKTTFLIVWILVTVLMIYRVFKKMNRNLGLAISVLFTLLTTYGLNIFFGMDYWLSLCIAIVSFIFIALIGKQVSLRLCK